MARKKYSAEFKTKVALEAIKGEETTSQIASRFGIHPAQVRKWKRQMQENASIVFEKSRKKEKEKQVLVDWLYREIGQLKVELDFLSRKSGLA
jgi:transposase